MSEFIFMLTQGDVTVPDARALCRRLTDQRLRYVGFKDIGLPVEELRELVDILRSQGRIVLLEVVSERAEDERHSVEAALELGVDYLLGGVHVDAALRLLDEAGSDRPKYFPFAGKVVDHPSILSGSIESVTSSALDLTARDGVAGVDLLAYRFTGDPELLLESVASRLDAPVIAAGSVNSIGRVRSVQQNGSWAFTVGTAVFERRFHRDGNLNDQLAAILDAVEHGAPGRPVNLQP